MRRRGEFWGRTSGTVELLSCEVRQLQATAPENEVPHHGHEAAHFVFVPGGEYISSATGAPELSRLPLLVFNPAGTEHRDRFLNGRGGFMTITLSSQIETPGGGAVALNSFDALRVARLLVQKAPKRATGWLHQSYALRRAPEGGLEAAWDALLPAVARKLLSR